MYPTDENPTDAVTEPLVRVGSWNR
jgi:hypothetical protein